MSLLQQPGTEILARHTEGRQIRIHIECSLGLKAVHPYPAKSRNNELSPAVIFLRHLGDISVAVSHSLERGILTRGRRAHDGVLMYLEHLICNLPRSGGIPEPPARHGICLREAARHYRPLAHSGQRRYRDMPAPVGQLCVDLVGQDKNVGPAKHLGKRLQLLSRHDSAGGIVRIGQDKHLCAGSNCRAELLRSYLEAILLLCFEEHGRSTRHSNDGPVADKAGHRNDNLVALLHTCADGKVDGLTAADGNNYLILGVIADTEPAVEIP